MKNQTVVHYETTDPDRLADLLSGLIGNPAPGSKECYEIVDSIASVSSLLW